MTLNPERFAGQTYAGNPFGSANPAEIAAALRDLAAPIADGTVVVERVSCRSEYRFEKPILNALTLRYAEGAVALAVLAKAR